MPEKLAEACSNLSRLIMNPYAVQRYEQHRQNIHAAWPTMSTPVSKNTNGGLRKCLNLKKMLYRR